jgi:hypothetical protein
MSTHFDPAAFLDLPVDEVQVKRPPIAAGDYTAVIENVEAKAWQSKDKYDEAGQLKAGIKYEVTLNIEIPAAEAERVGLTLPLLKKTDSIMLELNAGGQIDTAPGKNAALRKYRDALDMNKPGQPFVARAMIGQALRVKISHDEWPRGSGELVEQVSGVARLG